MVLWYIFSPVFEFNSYVSIFQNTTYPNLNIAISFPIVSISIQYKKSTAIGNIRNTKRTVIRRFLYTIQFRLYFF